MEYSSINDKEILTNFLDKHKLSLDNPLVKGFLKDQTNFELFKTAILVPTKENKELVEKSFGKHCRYVRKIKYIDSLIRFYSIDFDKKIRKNNSRHLLILDSKSIYLNAEEGQLLENRMSPIIEEDYYQGEIDMKNEITNSNLFKALESLTKKQALILELFYFKKLSIHEIAIALDSSPQNISNIHRRAIFNLKKKLIN